MKRADALSRRRFVGAAASAFGSIAFVRCTGSAAEFTLKYASAQQLNNPVTIRVKEAAERMRTESNGRIDFQVFPNSQLGGDTIMLSQLRSGAIQFLTFLDGVLASLVPVSAISNVGFAFEKYDDVFDTLDGPLGAHVRAQIERAGLHVFDRIWDNGFRQITASAKPIVEPRDLAGFKIRVPASAIEVSLFKELGAAPTSMNFSQVYSALQTRIVDGQENPLTIIEDAKLYEVQKFASLTNHVWSGFWFLANGAAWQKLPPDIREIVARNLDRSAVQQRVDSRALGTSLVATLQAHGMSVNRPDAAPFRQALRHSGFYGQWRKTFGERAWSLLQKGAGPLG